MEYVVLSVIAFGLTYGLLWLADASKWGTEEDDHARE